MKHIEVIAEVTGRVWKFEVQPGTVVSADDTLLIVESMKMEIPVIAPQDGKLLEYKVAEGDAVEEGQIVAIIEG